MIVHSTEFKTNLGKYLDLLEKEDVYVLRNNKPVAKMTQFSHFSDADLLKENADIYSFKPSKIVYEDFLNRYEATDERLEYIDGVVYGMGSPSVQHQRIVVELSNIFYNSLKEGSCKHYVAPLDVHFESSENKACVQPDVLVICDNENIRDGKYYGVPTLVVEITSPSTKSKDGITKLNLYWREGVKEYLLIDPIKEQVLFWHFEDGVIINQGLLKTKELYVSHVFTGLSFDIGVLF